MLNSGSYELISTGNYRQSGVSHSIRRFMSISRKWPFRTFRYGNLQSGQNICLSGDASSLIIGKNCGKEQIVLY